MVDKSFQKDSRHIQELARKLNFNIESIDFRGEYAPRFQVAVVKDRESKSYILKLLTSQDVYDKKGFLVEEKFLRLAGVISLAQFVPRLIKSNVERFPWWYLREYSSFTSAGNITYTFGFVPEFLSGVEPSQMVDFLQELWKFGTKEEAQKWLPIRRSLEMPEFLIKSLARNRAFLSATIVSKAEKMLDMQGDTLRYSTVLFSHNDLYPDNILFHQGDFKIIDWERCGFDYPLSDAAFLKLMSWRDSAWQQEFQGYVLDRFSSFNQKQLGKGLKQVRLIYWRVMSLYWISRLLTHCLLMAKRFRRENDHAGREIAEELAEYLKREVTNILS